MGKEIWKPFLLKQKLITHYEISSHGRLRNTKNNRIVKAFMNFCGTKSKIASKRANIYINKVQLKIDMSNEVYRHFIDPDMTYKKPLIHIDGDRSNIAVSNLKLKFPRYNYTSHLVNYRTGKKYHFESIGEVSDYLKLSISDIKRMNKQGRVYGNWIFFIDTRIRRYRIIDTPRGKFRNSESAAKAHKVKHGTMLGWLYSNPEKHSIKFLT